MIDPTSLSKVHLLIGVACEEALECIDDLALPGNWLILAFPEYRKHPQDFKHLADAWRESEMRVIAATHHPYLVDHFQPNEVTLCTYNPDGSLRFTQLDCENVQSEYCIFHLGEVWSGCDAELMAVIERKRD